MAKMAETLMRTMVGAIAFMGALLLAANFAFASDPMAPYHARGTIQGIVDAGLSNPDELPEILETAFGKDITSKGFSRADAEVLIEAALTGDRSMLLSALFWLGYIGNQADRDWRHENLEVATTSMRRITIVAVRS